MFIRECPSHLDLCLVGMSNRVKQPCQRRQRHKACRTNNPQNKHLSPSIYLSWGLRRCESCFGNSCVCVCVATGRKGGGSSLAWFWSVWPKGPPPTLVLSTPEQKPRYSGRRFKSNKLLQRFRDDIWRYQHAEAGEGRLTRP